MLKPFNLEAARGGAKCVTRGGKPARLVSEKGYVSGYPLMFLVMTERDSERHISVNENGEYVNGGERADDILLDVEPTYKPFTCENAPVGKVVKWGNGESRHLVVSCSDSFIYILVGKDVLQKSYKYFLEDFVFDNGEPCGILES